MPAVFAHDLYGRKLERTLPAAARAVIRRHRDCFYLGLQGPDPLFFYRPIGENSVRLRGNKIHGGFGADFFDEGLRAVREKERKGEEKSAEAIKAYLLGFCCHFALDSSVHGWIIEMHETSPYCHTALETELDRRLMAKEGYRPLQTDRASHIKNTKETRMAASRMLGVGKETAWESILFLRLFNRLFIVTPEWFKALFCKGVWFMKEAVMIRGMFMKKEPPEGIGPFGDTLEAMYFEAFPTGKKLLLALWEAMETGTGLSQRFYLNFNSRPWRQDAAGKKLEPEGKQERN